MATVVITDTPKHALADREQAGKSWLTADGSPVWTKPIGETNP